jgi:hypothetical protein
VLAIQTAFLKAHGLGEPTTVLTAEGAAMRLLCPDNTYARDTSFEGMVEEPVGEIFLKQYYTSFQGTVEEPVGER